MARSLTCDMCKRPTNRIIAKLLVVPANGKFSFANYTSHADIGECCMSRLSEAIKFRKRKVREKKPLVKVTKDAA